MTKVYNSKKISDYLLGSLSAEETEQLDELSVTDAEFAGDLVASESELVDSYVLNELDEATRRRFESHYLATYAGREKVTFAETLQHFGRQQQFGATATAGTSGWFSRLKSHLGGHPVFQWGFATAGVILLAAMIWLAFQNMRLRSEVAATQAHNNELVRSQQELQRQLEQAQAPVQASAESPENVGQPGVTERPASSTAVLSLVLKPMLRGGKQEPTLKLASDTTAVSVRLVLEPNDLATYRVALLAQGERVWQSGNLKAGRSNGSQSLSVTLPVRVLKGNDYVLRVSGTDKNGTSDVLGDYPFRISQTVRSN